jgi:hypothetical protein
MKTLSLYIDKDAIGYSMWSNKVIRECGEFISSTAELNYLFKTYKPEIVMVNTENFSDNVSSARISVLTELYGAKYAEGDTFSSFPDHVGMEIKQKQHMMGKEKPRIPTKLEGLSILMFWTKSKE